MRRFFIHILLASALVCLWGCPREAAKVEWGEAVYRPDCAVGYEILSTEGSSTLLRILSPWQGAKGVVKELFIARGGESAPEGFTGSVVKAAPERLVCMSSSHIAFIDALGAVERIVGVSGGEYISNEHVKSGLATGEVRDIGYDANMNYELLASMRPDLVLIYGTSGDNGAMVAKLDELAIPYTYIAEHAETTPLGKSEWVVAVGEILDCRAEAEEIFMGIAERYESLRLSALDFYERPNVMLNAPYKDVWFVPADDSYMVRLIEDAGGNYLCKGSSIGASRPISGESALLYLSQADVWLHPNMVRDMAQLVAENPKFAATDVVAKREVYNCTARSTAAGGSDFWESGALRADVALGDMIRILHPEESRVDELYYYERLK